ncbi:hypothetical protein QNI19_37025 [Cytophagaceae bacterium DM2B3-1]|uniref:Adhesin domain-containing protein n=2 Tax=Xanthocytophaga flava TaxID=3048013 RepID=A0ABT7CXX6_9BACT|nr:hypothetical protein [Xanthocytophaga flavus]
MNYTFWVVVCMSMFYKINVNALTMDKPAVVLVKPVYNLNPKDADTTITLQQTYVVSTDDNLVVDFSVPVKLTVIESKTQVVEVRLSLTGKSIKANAEQKAKTLKLSASKEELSGYVKTGELLLAIPATLKSQFTLQEGQILFNATDAKLQLQLQRGDVKLLNAKGNYTISVNQGSITCQKSQIQGSLKASSGLTQIIQSKGHFLATTGSGFFTVNSPSQDVNASIQKGQMDLKVAEGNVFAQIRDGNFSFEWQGKEKVQAQQFDIRAINSIVLLNFPVGFSMDLNLDQNQTHELLASTDTTAVPTLKRKGKKMKLESEFALTKPTEKEIIHRGKKMKIAQSHQLINGGANKVSIHSTDSEVYFKKLKGSSKN